MRLTGQACYILVVAFASHGKQDGTACGCVCISLQGRPGHQQQHSIVQPRSACIASFRPFVKAAADYMVGEQTSYVD